MNRAREIIVQKKKKNEMIAELVKRIISRDFLRIVSLNSLSHRQFF